MLDVSSNCTFGGVYEPSRLTRWLTRWLTAAQIQKKKTGRDPGTCLGACKLQLVLLSPPLQAGSQPRS